VCWYFKYSYPDFRICFLTTPLLISESMFHFNLSVDFIQNILPELFAYLEWKSSPNNGRSHFSRPPIEPVHVAIDFINSEFSRPGVYFG